jgi:hypothetical protein
MKRAMLLGSAMLAFVASPARATDYDDFLAAQCVHAPNVSACVKKLDKCAQRTISRLPPRGVQGESIYWGCVQAQKVRSLQEDYLTDEDRAILCRQPQKVGGFFCK